MRSGRRSAPRNWRRRGRHIIPTLGLAPVSPLVEILTFLMREEILPRS